MQDFSATGENKALAECYCSLEHDMHSTANCFSDPSFRGGHPVLFKMDQPVVQLEGSLCVQLSVANKQVVEETRWILERDKSLI